MTEPASPEQAPAVGPSVPMEPAPAGSQRGGTAAATHGFLFADLRDYTGYVETHGDRAGAALLDRYRALVRGAVAVDQGAEIRTEGDSFFVVFGSVGSAVRCGLAIVEAAAATAGGSPDPIRVGVGVHAGETIETTEGFVGSAVNIAARLCAQANAGDLVVSETVRGLTRTSLEVTFEPLGARHLKGVPEPVPCYRVVPRGGAAQGPVARPAGRRRWLIAAGLVAVVAAVVAAAGAAALGGGQVATPTAGPADTGGPSDAAVASASASPASPTAAPASSPSLGPFPTDAESEIMAALPPSVVSNCARGGTPEDAVLAGFVGSYHTEETEHAPAADWPVTPRVLAGITCQPPRGADRLYVAEPDRPAGWGLKASSWADEYIIRLTGRWAIPLGSCADDAKAYERWRTPRGTGILACIDSFQGRPWIYFTFDGGRYLGFATRDDVNADALYAWFVQLKPFLP